jgi:hypothetical protein
MLMNATNFYTSGRSKYNINEGSGYYIGSTSTTYNTSSTILGEWVQIELPYSLFLTSFVLFPATGFYNYLPKSFVVLGSVNGTDFTLLFSVTNHVYPAVLKTLNNYDTTTYNQTFTVTNNSQPYKYFRLVINRIANDWNGAGYGGSCKLQQWNLFGYTI